MDTERIMPPYKFSSMCVVRTHVYLLLPLTTVLVVVWLGLYIAAHCRRFSALARPEETRSLNYVGTNMNAFEVMTKNTTSKAPNHAEAEAFVIKNTTSKAPNHAEAEAFVIKNTTSKAPNHAEAEAFVIIKNTISNAPPVDRPRPSRGYVFAGHYWEQQTCASLDLQNLQCWAAISGLSVVEPYTSLSTLRTPFIALPHGKVLRFSDLFDLKSWNGQNKAMRYSQLVPWEEFIEDAPRNVIMVKTVLDASDEMQDNLNAIAQKFKAASANPLSQFVTKYTMDCDVDEDWRSAEEVNYMARNNFTVVRRTCINFAQTPDMSVDTFNKLVFGEFLPSETVVYFRDWRRTGAFSSVQIRRCQQNYHHEQMLPNKHVAAKADAYVATYLNGSDYIAVMARMEKSMLSLHFKNALQYCLTQTLNEWRKLRESSRLQTNFLAADMGSHGTLTSQESDRAHFEDFVQQIYGGPTTVQEWERTFEEVAGTTDSGYIALLQKLIVARSKCVLFVGGGAFQRHALRLFRKQNPTNHCFKIVAKCTRDQFPAALL